MNKTKKSMPLESFHYKKNSTQMDRILKDQKLGERTREKSVQVITTKQSQNNLITLTEESHK